MNTLEKLIDEQATEIRARLPREATEELAGPEARRRPGRRYGLGAVTDEGEVVEIRRTAPVGIRSAPERIGGFTIMYRIAIAIIKVWAVIILVSAASALWVVFV